MILCTDKVETHLKYLMEVLPEYQSVQGCIHQGGQENWSEDDHGKTRQNKEKSSQAVDNLLPIINFYVFCLWLEVILLHQNNINVWEM